jgi:hypothetical protein
MVNCLAVSAGCGPRAEGGSADGAVPDGTYSLDRGGDAGCFLNAGTLAEARVRLQVSCFGGPPAHNSGWAEDTVAARGSEAVIRVEYSGPCELRVRFHGDSAEVRQTGSDADCGFGNRVYAGGTYHRSSRAPDFVKYLPNTP